MDKNRKALRILGSLIILGAFISLVIGAHMTRTEHQALLLSGERRTLLSAISGGIGVMISAVTNLAEGVTSLMASKDARFAGPAWVCSFFSVLSNLISGISSIAKSGFSMMTLAGLITAIGLAINVYVAAGRLKQSYPK
ncbi:MAG: hypothetical protein II529_00405 [Erysipelotrichaceae bacterium]|nr:hypothetical protein [Erysipelotrichaceae bacterium]